MIRNNIDNLYNTDYDPNDWKTWNYRTIDADSHWRGIYQFAYNTDNPLFEPLESCRTFTRTSRL